MITSFTLENYRSFGERQTIPLEPLTVIVGPNNSGKSSFLGLGRFIQKVVASGAQEAFAQEGGEEFLFHRPRPKGSELVIRWESELGFYSVNLSSPARQSQEHLEIGQPKPVPIRYSDPLTDDVLIDGKRTFGSGELPFQGLRVLISQPERFDRDPIFPGFAKRFLPIVEPIVKSRFVKLSLDSLRMDSEVVPEPQLAADGGGLAAVLALWRGSQPDRSDALEEFLRKALPEVKRALVRPSPRKSYQRLWIEQKDGELFDAPHLSDGILFFTALAMHAIDMPPGAILFVEEPELCVHPRRLHDLVNLFRQLSSERPCQIVITTHSPILLNEFRDEPEAILLFQRGERGTRVKRLSELPELAQVLYKTEPGSMLANGFFNEPF